jgi:RNA polymerase sigma-70 factor, ECF subfamily
MTTDSAIMEQWLDDYGGALYAYALLQVRNQDVAEDLVQDTLLAAWKSFATFKGDASVKT